MAIQEIRPQPGPQEAFMRTSADVAIYGGGAGSGKSYGLLLEPLRHADNPEFGGVIFRRTSPMITNEGGLWDESTRLYSLVGAKPYQTAPPYWTFRSGASLSFAHLQHDKNVYDWQGAQIPFIGWDELTHFTEAQFFYMMSRNRSTCGVRPYMRATTNPDADSWVRQLIDWWIDPLTGLPIPERSGVVRWFYRIDNALKWYDSKREAMEANPELAAMAEPTSLTFIPALLDDNPALMARDPGYRARLMALPLVERERLLGGNWNIRPDAGLYFRRTYFDIVRAVPAEAIRVRYWDKAATAGGGDYTVGVLMAKASDGLYYIEHVERGQWSAHERDVRIRQTAELDRQRYPGGPPTIWIEAEGGSGGKQSAEISKKDLAGFNVRTEHPTGSKIVRAEPFSAQAEAGNVKIVADDSRPWDIEAFMHEAEQFPGGAHDDQVDAASGAFNKLAMRSATVNVYSLA